MTEPSHADKLVDPQWIADNLDNPKVRLIQLSSMRNPNAYAEGHIPGAIHWPWMESLWHPEMRDFVRPRDLAERMGRSGIRRDSTVVFYSEQIQYAAYAFWVCTLRGYDHIRIMNGNSSRWVKEGRPTSQEIPDVTPVECPAPPVDESARIGRDGILAGLNHTNRVLLDMRSSEEYNGLRVSPPWFAVDHGATRKGHIPGAKHIFYGDLLDEDERFKPLTALRKVFVRAGATPDKEIVTYCRLSHRASMTWFILRYLLGYPRVKVYDGSWTEWGSIVGVPIVNRSRADGAVPEAASSSMLGC